MMSSAPLRRRIVGDPPQRRRTVSVRRRLRPRAHAVYQVGAGLLLVFKPRGHHEPAHAHAHRQRLRVLRGRLVVRTARRAITLAAESRPFTLSAGRQHTTLALADTWLIAESLPDERARD